MGGEDQSAEIQRQLGRIAADVGEVRGGVRVIGATVKEHGKLLHDMHAKISDTKVRNEDHSVRIKTIEANQAAHATWRTSVGSTYLAVATLIAALASGIALWKSFH